MSLDFKSLNEWLISPVFDHVLLTKGLVLFALFLLLARWLPSFARNLTILLISLALIEIATSPFYTFLFVGFTGFFYYLFFWIQWSQRKKLYSYLLAAFLVTLFFLLMDWEVVRSSWTGQMVHRFGIAYSLFRFLYVILDVGKGRILPSDPLEFFVYAFFLPTFFQGPVERLDEFRTNLSDATRPQLSWRDTGSNLIRVGTALAKGWVAMKFFDLDWQVYFDHPEKLSYGFLWWGMYARAISFYLMVSAANDFTISLSALAGFHIHENYHYPYFKRNLAQFWRSWHMTLFRFIRDYVYIPMGGNRKRIYFNTLVVFMFVALWHVTSPAFVIWGLWHGVGMCLLRLWQNYWKSVEAKNVEHFSRCLQRWSRRWPRVMALASTVFTFHFVAFGWLPFWGGHPQGLSMILRLISGNRWNLFVWD